MSTQLQQYQFNTHQFRVIPDDQGEPWFVAKDVCGILGYKNSSKAIKDHCRKSGITNSYTPALSNTYNLIDEGNLYRLIIKSNKPQSQAFEDWVCDKILPSIRKTGGYQKETVVDNAPQLQTLETENSQLKAQLSQQNEMLELYRFKAGALEQQTKPKPKRKANRPLTQNDINAIHGLKAEGFSNNAIAKKVNRSPATVSFVLRGATA